MGLSTWTRKYLNAKDSAPQQIDILIQLQLDAGGIGTLLAIGPLINVWGGNNIMVYKKLSKKGGMMSVKFLGTLSNSPKSIS